jgi:hypothetical protein
MSDFTNNADFPPSPPTGQKCSKTTAWVLGVVGGLFLIGIILLIVFLTKSNGGTCNTFPISPGGSPGGSPGPVKLAGGLGNPSSTNTLPGILNSGTPLLPGAPPTTVPEITAQQALDMLNGTQKSTFIVVQAGCGPCISIKQKVNTLAASGVLGNANVGLLPMTEWVKMKDVLPTVKATPHLFKVSQGRTLASAVGNMPEKDLVDFINK